MTFSCKPLWRGLGMFQIIQKVTSNVKPDTASLQDYSQLRQICNRCFDDIRVRPSSIQLLQELLMMSNAVVKE